jgi:hypothetical protein
MLAVLVEAAEVIACDLPVAGDHKDEDCDHCARATKSLEQCRAAIAKARDNTL